MKLYITRHGQTEWNIIGRMQGWNDSPLTLRGINNAISLGKHLKEVKFDEVYSSSVGRTIHTAELITGLSRNSITAVDELREIGMGCWEGKLRDEIEDEHPMEYSYFWRAPHLFSLNSAETFQDVQNRALKLVHGIIEKYKHTDKNILLVTHTVTLKTIMAYFEGRSLEKLWEPPYIHDTSLSMVEVNEKGHRIILHGDISHIDQEDAC